MGVGRGGRIPVPRVFMLVRVFGRLPGLSRVEFCQSFPGVLGASPVVASGSPGQFQTCPSQGTGAPLPAVVVLEF